MLLGDSAIFCDPREDLILPVIELGLDEISSPSLKLDENHFYLVGDYVYKYKESISMKIVPDGIITKFGDRYFISPHDSRYEDFYNRKYITTREEYEERIRGGSIKDTMEQYAKNYKKNKNIILSGNIKITPTGDVYMPELSPTDDPLERIIKLMLRHMKLVLNEYRGQFAKKHGLDNIKSALNGATKNMSILKFLSWCENFDLDWEITLGNSGVDIPNPIGTTIVISSTEGYPWEDIPEETPDCFTVPLTDGEDPLKRAVKLALYQKQIDLKEYRKKSPTQHLLNNMKSALKSKQKMTLPYFINWCEIIDMSYSFKVTNRADGIWYRITGYDMTTNDKELA
jgi:hypothetical protein